MFRALILIDHDIKWQSGLRGTRHCFNTFDMLVNLESLHSKFFLYGLCPNGSLITRHQNIP